MKVHGHYVGELVAHPPLGKIMMAVGQWTFGLTPFGWRFTVAVIGTVSILMLARIVRRMTRSTMLGCVAGLLLALDGLEIVSAARPSWTSSCCSACSPRSACC